jgi:RNA polymerase sigma factor (sigma-70 family)
MVARPSDLVHTQMHRLFNFGAVGTLSDAQLLDLFVSRSAEAAEAAFEELVIRHGPMVHRVCRGVLHDVHDAEDAFQAVFLVLASRARSIRRSASVASWLFGVAQRVAYRAKRSAARRQALHQVVADRSSESYLPVENDPDAETLHEEISSLPERLRAPVVLCYLQGLTYAAAAHQLGLSEMAIRGRLARARARLRQRLTRRGVTVPAGFLVAGAAGHTLEVIPMALVHSTIRVALGFLAGNAANVLARGVLNSILLNRAKVATLVFFLGIVGCYWVWYSFAAAVDGENQANPGPAVVSRPASSPPPRADRYGDPLPLGAAMRLGTIRFRQFPYICHVVYSPDGQLVVTDTGENFLQVWNARDGRKLRRIEAGMEQIRDFAFSPDGKMIAALGCGSVPERLNWLAHLTFLDVATGRLVRRGEWDLRESERVLAFAPDGKTVATETADGTLRVWDVATAKLLHQERLGGRQGENVASIAFSPHPASHLLAIASERVIHLWDTAHLRDARTIAVEGEHPPTGLAFSPDGMTLAAGIKTVARDEQVGIPERLPDGTIPAAAKRAVGAEIRLWRVSDGTLLRRYRSQKSTSVRQVGFSPDGKLLAAEGFQGPLVLFDAGSGKELAPFGRELDLVENSWEGDSPMAFSPDGRTLATLGSRQALHFWDLATGNDRLATPEAHLGSVFALAFPADGKTLISGSDDRTVRIWDLAMGHPTKTLAEDGWVWSLAVTPDGSFLAAGIAYPRNVHLWNLKRGERLHSWPIEGNSSDSVNLRGVTLGKDGSSVTVALADGSFRGWDLWTRKERAIAQPKLEKPLDPATAAALPPVPLTARLAAFSRDGRSKVIVRTIPGESIKLANGEIRYDRSSAGSTIVWLDTHTGHVRREFEIPQSDVQRLALSPDEQCIAVGYFSTLYPPARGFIRIFRLRDKREIQTIETPCAWIDALGFTADGKQIVAGLQDTSIVLWDVHPVDGRR